MEIKEVSETLGVSEDELHACIILMFAMTVLRVYSLRW